LKPLLVICDETGIVVAGAYGLTIGAEGAGNTLADNVQSGIYFFPNADEEIGLVGGRRTGVFANAFLRNNVGVTFD
jgi:hypothetical protein